MRKAWKEKNFGTSKFFESVAWDKLQLRAVNGRYPEKHRKSVNNGIHIEMTRDEFHKWVEKMKPVIEALYRAGEIPTLKRIDLSRGYGVDNILVATNAVRGSLLSTKQSVPFIYLDKSEFNFRSFCSQFLAKCRNFFK